MYQKIEHTTLRDPHPGLVYKVSNAYAVIAFPYASFNARSFPGEKVLNTNETFEQMSYDGW